MLSGTIFEIRKQPSNLESAIMIRNCLKNALDLYFKLITHNITY